MTMSELRRRIVLSAEPALLQSRNVGDDHFGREVNLLVLVKEPCGQAPLVVAKVDAVRVLLQLLQAEPLLVERIQAGSNRGRNAGRGPGSALASPHLRAMPPTIFANSFLNGLWVRLMTRRSNTSRMMSPSRCKPGASGSKSGGL